MNELAIIGPTASGKSDLALEVAQIHNAYIFSIDSLSIYKEIDIASAKPSKEELAQVKHFGIDVLYPDEHFSVSVLINLYQELKAKAFYYVDSNSPVQKPAKAGKVEVKSFENHIDALAEASREALEQAKAETPCSQHS